MRRATASIRRGGPARLAAVIVTVLATGALQGSNARDDTPNGILHTLPLSTRPYEVLLPPGEAKNLVDMPVLLYLHPAGDPQLDRAKRDYWPSLVQRKCLMVLPRSKSRKAWLAGEEKYVLDVLADVRARYAVDPKRICLLGVSGGGQVALFLADHLPEKFRAVMVVSTNPVVVRGERHEWFYPARKVVKTCPYFVVNHITQGAALMYWRQVRARLAPVGASISILPVTGKAGPYQPPPKQLGPWLDAVLAGKHPTPLPDPQKAAVAKMFEKCVAALPKAIAAAEPRPAGARITKEGEGFRLFVATPSQFERSTGEDKKDSTGAALTQIRIEHRDWPIYVRCGARATEEPMDQVLSSEEQQTILRGLLYQVYYRGNVPAGRSWSLTIGSITYPDRRRGWVSALFLQAAAPMKNDPKKWLTVLVRDETQQPDPKELAVILKTVLATLTAEPVAKEE